MTCPKKPRLLLLSLLFYGGLGVASAQAQALDIDPWENFNRSVFEFNTQFDQAILKPVAKSYRDHVPSPVRTGVNNFFGNLSDLYSFANNVLQLKPQPAISDLARVALNTTVGIYGLMDVASAVGIPKYREDFGQTLGRWGVSTGPYLVVPFVGPSSLRDVTGLVVEPKINPISKHGTPAEIASATVVKAVDVRAEIYDAMQALEDIAIDPYTFTRDAYLQRRLNSVNDGAAPAKFVDEAR
jgi:phospholipid-binding lipoprotein MlaA